MGLKKWIFGETSVSEKAEKVLKDKKMPLLLKYETLQNLYAKYFNNQIEIDAKMALWELHYEKLVKNKVLQRDIYDKYFKIEKENLAFCYSFILCRQFGELLKQGLDVKNLENKQFAYEVLKLKESCDFSNKYDGTRFYQDKEHRNKILNSVNQFVENCKKMYQPQEEMTW